MFGEIFDHIFLNENIHVMLLKIRRILPWLVGTKHFPESKTLPRIQKHFPESKNMSQKPKHFPESKTLPIIQQHVPKFWILGRDLPEI